MFEMELKSTNDVGPAPDDRGLEASMELASSLLEWGSDLETAERCVLSVLAIDPDNQRANMLAGAIYGRLGNHIKSAQFSSRAFLLSGKTDRAAGGNLAAAAENLPLSPGIVAVVRDVVDSQPDNIGALLTLIAIQQEICQWDGLAELTKHFLANLDAAQFVNVSPFKVLGMHGVTRSQQRRLAASFSQFTKSMFPHLDCGRAQQLGASRKKAGKKLNLGYLSSDFHNHPTSYLVVGVFEQHDRSRFNVHAFSFDKETSCDIRTRIRAGVDFFHDLHRASPSDCLSTIRDAEIDILVDLNGWTHNKRFGIADLRPAPVIVNWLGYPGTMGLPELADYIVGDSVVTPLEEAEDYTELLALMPYSYQPNDSRREIGPAPSRQQAGLPENAFVFCSFNASYKFSPELFDVWCRLLNRVPGSILWLLEPSELARANLIAEANRRGVRAERLVFAPRLGLKEHLGRLQLADLALDTLPYNSHTTGSDALWVSVPMVTCKGDTFAGRVGASLLKAVGLNECITENLDDYFQLALALATDYARLQEMRDHLRSARATAPLFDTASFTRDLERLYRRMWQDHLAGRRDAIILSQSGHLPRDA